VPGEWEMAPKEEEEEIYLARAVQCSSHGSLPQDAGDLVLGLLKINQLSGPEDKTGPETAGPVNCDCAII